MIIGIIGYFTIPTVAEWVIQSGGAGGAMGGINKAGAFATGVAGGIAGNMIGRTFGRRGGGGSSSGNSGGGPASGSAPTGATWQHKVTIIIHNNLDNGIQVIKNIETSFRQIRLFGIVFLCLCALVSVFSVVASFRFAEKQREKIYVLTGASR